MFECSSILLVVIILLGIAGSASAQIADHEPGETLAHFRAAEHDKTVCLEAHDRRIAQIMHEKYENPGTCTLIPWQGKTYLFHHDDLVRIDVVMHVSYDEAVQILATRYGKPVGRNRIFELRSHNVAHEQTYWHPKDFGVWAFDMSYVSDQGNSGRFVNVIVEADSEHAPEKINSRF
jgi:hypothetical protein